LSDVTVVLPTRDRAGLVLDAVACALGQEGVSVQVIVVDDGSRDDTAGRVCALGDPRLELIRHERSLGVSRSRNEGAARARGQWLAFLDDDDLWAPGWLRAALDAGAGGADLVYGGFVVVNAARQALEAHLPERPEGVRDALARSNVVGSPSGVVLRRGLLERAGGFDERLQALADWELWRRLLVVGTPAAVPDLLVAYTLHEDNMHLRTPDAVLAELAALEARGLGGRDVAEFARWMAMDSKRFGLLGQGARLYLLAARRSRNPRDVARAARVLLDRRTSARDPGRHPLGPAWLSRWVPAEPGSR
jgi:glycosyltransferase involved in cell wall biosynthesis